MAELPRELPRDINAGAMAAVLFESGKFGKEIDFCAALAWNGQVEQLFFENEIDCCTELLKRYNAGELVSDYEYRAQRIAFERSEVEAKKEAYQAVVSELETPFAERVSAFQEAPFDSHEEAFAAYFQTLDDDSRVCINGLLGLGLQRKWLSREFASSWRRPEPDLQGKLFAGYAHKVDGTIKLYANAYLPDVWKHWRKTPGASAIYVGAVKANAPIPQLRRRFEEQMGTLFDERYFELIES